MKFWIREIQLTIGDKQWIKNNQGGLEINFDIQSKTNEDKEETQIDLSTISITNLSRDSINSIEKGDPVILNAGYKGLDGVSSVGNLLVGRVEEVSSTRQGLEVVTEIKVSDGGTEWRNVELNTTYQAGTKASYIMRELANTMGYEIGIIKPKNDIEYKLGKSIYGKCSKNLKQLAKDTGSKMYIEKNKIYITDRKEGLENGFLISAKSGLLSAPQIEIVEASPEEKEKGAKDEVYYNLDTKLNHELVLDSYIQIESSTANGIYRIVEVTHRGSDFVTSLKVVGK